MEGLGVNSHLCPGAWLENFPEVIAEAFFGRKLIKRVRVQRCGNSLRTLPIPQETGAKTVVA